jgi:hypothetical protein
MLKYSQIYRRVEAEAKHEKEFDGSANNRGVIANRPYMDTWLTRHPHIGSVTETTAISNHRLHDSMVPGRVQHSSVKHGNVWSLDLFGESILN